MPPLYDNRPIDQEAMGLLEMLFRLKRRGQLLAVLEGLAWMSAGCILLATVLISGLGWWGGTTLRALGWAGVGVGAAALGIAALVHPLRKLARPEAVQRRVGQILPSFASDLLSASQLAFDPATAVFSKELVKGHLKAARLTLGQIPSSRVFPARALTWPAAALLASLGTGAALFHAMPGILKTGIENLWAESRPPVSETRRVPAKAPVLGDLAITLRYPEYLKRPERRLEAISGGLVAPLGTTVVLEGRALVPGADKGVVRLPNQGESSLSVGTDGSVHGRFVVGASGPFSFALGNDTLMVEGPEHRLDLEPDLPPTIRLLRPTRKIEIAEDGSVLLEFDAEDDHGLKYVDLIVRAESNLKLHKTILRLGEGARQVKTKYLWNPENIRLGEDAAIQLELEVYDNDMILGPKSGRSEPLEVRILTPLSRHKSALDDQGQALDGMVDLLAHRIEAPPLGNYRTEEALKRFTDLRGETEDLLGRTARLIALMNGDPLTPRRMTDAFVKTRTELSDQLLFETRLYNLPLADYGRRSAVDSVTIRLLENAILRIDDLIMEQQLSKLVSAGAALDEQHGEINLLLDRYIQTRAEASRRAVLDAIARMEEAIRRLHREVEAIRGKVGDTFVNPSAVGQLDLLGALQRLKALLAGGDLEAAAELVKRFKTDLERLMTGLEGGLLSFRSDRFGHGEKLLAALLEKIAEIEADQLQLRRETTALQRQYQERLAEVMRGRIDALVKSQLDRVRKMGKAMESIRLPGNDPNRPRLVEMQSAAKELGMALGQGDIEEARQIALEISDLANAWSADQGEQSPERLAEIRQSADTLREEVTEAYPKPGQLFSKKDRLETRRQSERERLLMFQTRKAKAWLDGQGDLTRFLSHRATKAFETVASQMSEAVSFLEESRTQKAVSAQSSALDELERLREDLKQGDEVVTIRSRPIVFRGKVEIPGPDDYEVPPEFRKDILKAMSGDLPNRYQEAIRKYYENLVQ